MQYYSRYCNTAFSCDQHRDPVAAAQLGLGLRRLNRPSSTPGRSSLTVPVAVSAAAITVARL
jgi:hypothetical protein